MGKKRNTSYLACGTSSCFTARMRGSHQSPTPLEKHWHTSFHLEVPGVNNNYTWLLRWFPVLQSTCPCMLEGKLTGPYLSQMQPQVFSWSCIPHNSYSNTSHAVPLHIRMFNMLWPCGHFANKSVGDGMGFLEMLPPQTLTGRPSDPILHRSGVGRSLWPPNRRC